MRNLERFQMIFISILLALVANVSTHPLIDHYYNEFPSVSQQSTWDWDFVAEHLPYVRFEPTPYMYENKNPNANYLYSMRPFNKPELDTNYLINSRDNEQSTYENLMDQIPIAFTQMVMEKLNSISKGKLNNNRIEGSHALRSNPITNTFFTASKPATGGFYTAAKPASSGSSGSQTISSTFFTAPKPTAYNNTYAIPSSDTMKPFLHGSGLLVRPILVPGPPPLSSMQQTHRQEPMYYNGYFNNYPMSSSSPSVSSPVVMSSMPSSPLMTMPSSPSLAYSQQTAVAPQSTFSSVILSPMPSSPLMTMPSSPSLAYSQETAVAPQSTFLPMYNLPDQDQYYLQPMYTSLFPQAPAPYQVWPVDKIPSQGEADPQTNIDSSNVIGISKLPQKNPSQHSSIKPVPVSNVNNRRIETNLTKVNIDPLTEKQKAGMYQSVNLDSIEGLLQKNERSIKPKLSVSAIRKHKPSVEAVPVVVSEVMGRHASPSLIHKQQSKPHRKVVYHLKNIYVPNE